MVFDLLCHLMGFEYFDMPLNGIRMCLISTQSLTKVEQPKRHFTKQTHQQLRFFLRAPIRLLICQIFCLRLLTEAPSSVPPDERRRLLEADSGERELLEKGLSEESLEGAAGSGHGPARADWIGGHVGAVDL